MKSETAEKEGPEPSVEGFVIIVEVRYWPKCEEQGIQRLRVITCRSLRRMGERLGLRVLQ